MIKSKNEYETYFKTQSLCPHCFRRIDANYIGQDDKVYLLKECPEHGIFKTQVWENIEHWKSWIKPFMDYKPQKASKAIKNGCPFDCGICRDHRQEICCVLFEVTSRCNMECPTCFASSNRDGYDVSLGEIDRWYKNLMSVNGPCNIQLSGGEPTVRDDLSDIISLGIKRGFNFFQINTNGIRIGKDKKYLYDLKVSGLNAVFLQFDGFQEKTYKSLRGANILKYKLDAIKNCKDLGIPVILVPTIKKDLNDKEIGHIINFAIDNMPYIRGVHFQPMSFFGRFTNMPKNEDRMTMSRLLIEIEKQSHGRIRMKDFTSGNSGHFMCTFNTDFIIKSRYDIKPITQGNQCCSGSKVRNIVANKWNLPSKKDLEKLQNIDLDQINSLDKFLIEKKIYTLTISSMAFQDIWNVDLNRLKRCYVHEYSRDHSIIPFCSYNITNIEGKSLYRENAYE